MNVCILARHRVTYRSHWVQSQIMYDVPVVQSPYESATILLVLLLHRSAKSSVTIE